MTGAPDRPGTRRGGHDRTEERLFALLVRTFPRGFRIRYGAEMVLFFRDRVAEPRHAGAFGRLRLWTHLIADVARAAPRERWLDVRARIARADTPAGRVTAIDDCVEDSMDTIIQDARYALRTLARRPAFTAIAAVTLALGIGANTAIFSVLNSLLLQPLRFPDAHELVVISQTSPTTTDDGVSFPNFVDWRERARGFRDMAIVRNQSINLTGGETPERLSGTFTSAGLF